MTEPTTPTQEPAPPSSAPAPSAPISEPQAPATPEPQAQSTPTQEPPVSQNTPQGQPPEPAKPSERIVPESYKLPEGVPAEVGAWAKANDMTQQQLDAVISQTSQYLNATSTAQQQQLRQMGEQHVESWGESKQYNLSLARRALAQNDPDGKLKAVLDQTGFGNHPVVLDFLHRLGRSMQEGGHLKSAIRRQPGQKTAAQAMFGANHPSIEA